VTTIVTTYICSIIRITTTVTQLRPIYFGIWVSTIKYIDVWISLSSLKASESCSYSGICLLSSACPLEGKYMQTLWKIWYKIHKSNTTNRTASVV
jgi:hypothetical protein